MSRIRNLIILLVVLVLLVVAVVAVQIINHVEEEVPVEETTNTIIELDPNAVTELGWFYVDETMAFEKTSDGWTYGADDSFPVDATYLDTMLTALTKVDAIRTIENVTNYAEYGLADPDCRVYVKAGELLELTFGNISAMGDSQYLSLGDGNVYLVDTAIQDNFELGLLDVVLMETMPEMDNVQLAMIKRDETQMSLVYQENSDLGYSNKYVWFLLEDEGYKTLGTNQVKNWLKLFQEMNWSSCVDYHAEEAELENYGLAEPTASVSFVKMDSNGGTAFGLEFGKVSGDYCYARLAGSSMVYKVENRFLESAQNTTYYDLRSSYVLQMDWTVLTGMDITLDGVTYEFRKAEGQDEYHMILDGAEVEVTVLRNMFNELTVTGHAEGVEAEQDAVMTIKFYQESQRFPEVEVAFCPYNSTDYLDVINGEALSFAPVERVNSVIQAVKAILNK